MNKTLTALKLAEEALNAMLTHMGMDEDEWTKPTFNQAREALSAIREALAEPVKQEPVAVVDEIGKRLDGTNIFNAIGKVDVGQPLYAAPVRTKDLTDDEILGWIDALPYDQHQLHLLNFARAVIAAYKEKNNANNNS